MTTTDDLGTDDLGSADWGDLNRVLEEGGVDVAAAVQGISSEAPVIDAPQDGPVRLPGGFRRYTGTDEVEEVTEAWVRELTGEDEERIAKARQKGNVAAVVDTILEGGVEKLGSEAPRKGELLDLLNGDREFLLLEISKATFGDELEYEQVTCPQCAESFGVVLHKSEDIPQVRLDKIEDAYFDVTLHRGDVAHVRLTTGREQRAIAASERTIAEINTLLLSKCVETITKKDGTEVVVPDEPSVVRKMGSRDREKILTEIGKRSPGPQYNEVRFKHEPGCGFELTFAVGLMELFRGL